MTIKAARTEDPGYGHHACPPFCAANVFKIAPGNPRLPGKVTPAK